MFSTRRTRKLGLLLGLVGLVAGLGLGPGCGDSGTMPPPPSSGTVTVQLEHTVAGQALVFQERVYTNSAGNHYDIYELRYYVSNVRLVSRTGVTPVGDVHYCDATVATTRSWQLDGVPNGEYIGVRLTFGLDSLRNVTGGLPATNDNLNMAWPVALGGGYHLMMLDGSFDGVTSADPWLAHLGRLKRDTDLVASGDSFEVELDFLVPPCPTCPPPAQGLVVDGNATEIELVMDVDEWFHAPRLYDFAVYGGNVMSNPSAQNDLHANGVDVFELGRVTGVRP